MGIRLCRFWWFLCAVALSGATGMAGVAWGKCGEFVTKWAINLESVEQVSGPVASEEELLSERARWPEKGQLWVIVGDGLNDDVAVRLWPAVLTGSDEE